MAAQKHWHRLNGHGILLKGIEGVRLVKGEIEKTAG